MDTHQGESESAAGGSAGSDRGPGESAWGPRGRRALQSAAVGWPPLRSRVWSSDMVTVREEVRARTGLKDLAAAAPGLEKAAQEDEYETAGHEILKSSELR